MKEYKSIEVTGIPEMPIRRDLKGDNPFRKPIWTDRWNF
jgi:hypothetical protein